jgi:hypothetical protein
MPSGRNKETHWSMPAPALRSLALVHHWGGAGGLGAVGARKREVERRSGRFQEDKL